MRFLLDQDVYALTERLLRGLGHDVVTASDIGMARANDLGILGRAGTDSRILVTRDKDFGALVFVEQAGKGVIYLRISPSTIDAIHNQPKRVLEAHSETDLAHAFIVVEPGGYRLRKLP